MDMWVAGIAPHQYMVSVPIEVIFASVSNLVKKAMAPNTTPDSNTAKMGVMV